MLHSKPESIIIFFPVEQNMFSEGCSLFKRGGWKSKVMHIQLCTRAKEGDQVQGS